MSLTFLVEEFRRAGARVEEAPVYEGASGKRYALALAAERGAEFMIVFEREEVQATDVLDAFRAAQDLQGRAVLVAPRWSAEARRWADRFRVRAVEPPAEVAVPAPELMPAPEPEVAAPWVDGVLAEVAQHAADLSVPVAPPAPRAPPLPVVDPVLAFAAAHAVEAGLPEPGLAAEAVARLAHAERVEAEDAEVAMSFDLSALVDNSFDLQAVLPEPAEAPERDASEIVAALRLSHEVLPLAGAEASSGLEEEADLEEDEEDGPGAMELPWGLPGPALAPAGAHLASLRGRTGLPWTPPAPSAARERVGLVQDGDAATAADRLRGVRAELEATGANTFGHRGEDERPSSNWLQSLRQ